MARVRQARRKGVREEPAAESLSNVVREECDPSQMRPLHRFPFDIFSLTADNSTLAIIGDTLLPIIRNECQTV